MTSSNCAVCAKTPAPILNAFPATNRQAGFAWNEKHKLGHSQAAIRSHLSHVKAERTAEGTPAETNLDDFDELADDATGATEEDLRARGYNPTRGWTGVTLTEANDQGIQHWRVRGDAHENVIDADAVKDLRDRIHGWTRTPLSSSKPIQEDPIHADRRLG